MLRRRSNQRFLKKKLKKPTNFLGLIRLVLIVGLVVTGVVMIQGVFKVKEVEVVFDSYACGNEEEVENGLKLYDQVIYLLNQERMNTRVKNEFPCVKEVRLNKYLPNKVAVLIIGRVPIASIVKGEGLGGMIDLAQVEATAASSAATVDFSIPTAVSDKFFMDQRGVLFYSTTGDVNIPVVYTDQDVGIRQNLGSEVGNGIWEVLNLLAKMELVPKLIKISNGEVLLIVTRDDEKIILNLKSDLLKQLASLQLIWQKNKIDAKRIDSIDLRFSKPVVVYSK